MIRAGLFVLDLALITAPTLRQSLNDVRIANALRDAARANERQADSRCDPQRIEADRAVQAGRARRNAARDTRSMRRSGF